MFQWYSCS